MPQSMEIVFPRGGKQRTGKPKFKSGKSEDLFKTEVESDAPPRKKRKKRSNESEAIKVNEVVVQNLSLQSIAEGMVLLGCVMEIEDYSLKISLPGRLYGTVPIVNISDNYTQLIKAFADNPGSVDEVATLQSLFRVGQTFPCKVMSTKANSSKSRRNQITISINPRHVNEGLRPASIMDGMHLFCAVQSIEDHGYVVDIGINGCPAFLSHDSMLEYVRYHNDGHSLSIGHIVPAVVNMPGLLEGKLHSGQVVALIANPTVVMKSKIKVSRDISLNVLTPGTVVDSVIEKVSESGLVVDCLGFPGCVHKNHMKKSFLQHSNCIKGLTAGGIVLYVHPITRVIHITMHSKPNPKKLSKMFGGLKRWSVVDDAIITEVHKHFIFLKLKGSVQGIAWEKELSDEPVQNVIKTFNVNDTVQCRVIALHYLDNMVSVSLKKSVLNQTYVSREDLRTGAVYEGKVKKLVPGGMVVTLSPGVQGFVRDIYMADVPIRKPEVMFPKGKEVKCKVLHIDRTSSPPSILLTCKKGMLQTKLPILSSYQDASPGLVTKGTIVNIKDSGLVLSFLNKVQGWVPSSELGAYKIQDPEKVFFRGQVVKCRVLNCYPEEEKLFLSLRIDNSKLFGNKDMSKEKFAVGTVVEVKINKKTEKGLDVVVKGTKFQAFLPVGHLSDHVENCQKLLETYKEKDVIDVLCFSSKGVPIVTRKSSLLKVAANGVFHSQISDFKDQTVLPVVVKHFARYGMFVELGYNIRGLVPNKFLADRKILKPEEAGYVINQTLLAKVIKVDTESNRIELSTKMMDIYHQEYNCGLDLLQSYFGDVSKMKEYYLTLDNTKSELARMAVGSVVLARVTSVTEIGVLCELHDGLKGFVTNHHCNNEVMKENEERHGVILYIDMENECIELSFSPQLVRNVSKAKVHESCKVRIDQVIKCEVLVIKKELVLVSLGGHAVGKFAYLPARRALNDLVGRQDLYTIGQHYHIVIMRIFDSSIVLGVLKQHVKDLKTNDTEKASALKRKNNKVDAPAKRQKKMQMGCSLNVHEQGFVNSNQNLVSLQSAEVHEVVCKSQSALTAPSVKPAVPEKQNHVEAVGDKFPSENSELVVGDKYVAVIKKIKEFQMDILINGRIPGRIHITEVANSVGEAVKPFKKYSKGNNIEVWVIGFHVKQSHNFLVLSHCQMKTYAECSLFEHPPAPLNPTYSIGDHLKGFIRDIDNTAISVWLTPQTVGTLPLYHMKADFKTLCRPSKHYRCGDVLEVQVLSISDEIELTQLGSWKPKAGINIVGLIQMVSADKGISVKLPHGYSGEVHLTDIRDSYISADRVLYPLLRKGLVQCHILEVNDGTKFCQLSTRSSRLTHSDRHPEDPELSGNDIRCGVIVRGFVKYITNSGLVILLGRNLEGMISTLTMELNEKNDILKAHSIGSLVTVKVDSDRDKKLALSIIYGHTDKADLPCDSLAKTEQRKSVAVRDESLKSQIRSLEPRIAVENPELQSPSIKTFPRLQVSKGFNFDAHTVAVDLKILEQSFPDSSDDNQEQDEKKHKRDDVLNEKDIFERENLLIDKNQLPGTADEFEELVKGSPNMAALWVRYMVFHLEQMDIDSARNIAERALKTISFREEEQKLKIWIAFLNLENLYGTQESLQEVFERALPLNEPSKLYNAMVDIYFRSNKVAEAENMYHIMVKKFHLNKEVWISFGLFYMKTGRPELARKVMDRSLKSLDQKHHIDIIGKFAEMEFKHGDMELGKTMFDGVLKNYPKRTDLWSIYIDLLIKFGDLSAVRKLFEQVTSMKLSARKMMFFFKRYLTFERQHGTAESCDEITRKASDYFKSDNTEWTR